MSLLTVEGLTKKYDKHFGVQDLTFTLNPGEILGLVGPNGAGKSTSIKALLGLIQPERGQVLIGPEHWISAFFPCWPHLNSSNPTNKLSWGFVLFLEISRNP